MNLIGKRFGRLEVVSNSDKHGYVSCKCDCGNFKDIRATSLTKKYQPTRSCGCIQKEFASSVSAKSISNNSEKQISSNRKFNTNFGSIICDKPKNNTSGHKGVSWCKSKGMWEAYISVHNKRIHLGRYHDIEDAVKARIEAEEKYFDPLLEVRNDAEGVL